MKRKDDIHILTILPDEAPAPPWTFTTNIAHSSEECDALMQESSYDCVLLICHGEADFQQNLSTIQQSCHNRMIPLVLAGSADMPKMEHLIESLSLDSFIDLTWPESLALGALKSAIHRFKEGRNLVEI